MSVAGDTFTVVVAVGFLLCLLMIPLSLVVLPGSVWYFLLGTLIFFAAGVLRARGEPDEAEPPEAPVESGLVESLRTVRGGDASAEEEEKAIFSRYMK